MTISLDSGPLSLITQRRGHAEADLCRRWLRDHLARGTTFVVPEVVDYELPRELLRAGKTASLLRLDTFLSTELGHLILITSSAL